MEKEEFEKIWKNVFPNGVTDSNNAALEGAFKEVAQKVLEEYQHRQQ